MQMIFNELCVDLMAINVVYDERDIVCIKKNREQPACFQHTVQNLPLLWYGCTLMIMA